MRASVAIAIIKRDLSIAFRSGGGWFYALFFFALFVSLSGVAIGPELGALRLAFPAVLWLGTAFSIQFAAENLFKPDIEDGSLRSLIVETRSLFAYWAGKLIIVFLTGAAPIAVASPLALVMFGGNPVAGLSVALILVVGAVGVVAMAVMTSAIAAGLKSGGLLATVIAAPFIAPILIFGVSALEVFLTRSVFWSPEMLILTAFSLFSLALTPGFALLALRAALE